MAGKSKGKTATVNTRIDAGLKADAEAVLRALRLTPTDAVRLLYTQIAFRRELPLELRLPNAETAAALEEVMSETIALGEFEPRKIARGDRLFGPLRDLLIILSAVAHASSLMAGGTTHRIAKPIMRASTRWPNYSLALPLRGPLESALKGTEPMEIVIGIITDAAANTQELPNPRLHTAGLHGVMAHVVAPIYLMFFERYNEWLNDTYGRDSTERWHPTLNFARVIRNAAAHGSITFRNPNAPPVSWRDISYSPADNGKRVIGEDIQLGEILTLMFEVHDALTEIGAPIL